MRKGVQETACKSSVIASVAGGSGTLTLEFMHGPDTPQASLQNPCCRAAVLKALAEKPADRIVLIQESKVIYDGIVAKALSELAETIGSLSPSLCIACSQKAGNIWEDPLAYYYLIRTRKCSHCSDELKRIAEGLRKSDFLREAVAAAKPQLAWSLPATAVPAFFAAEAPNRKSSDEVESYSVEGVSVKICRHPTRPDMLMLLDYPELRLSAKELAVLSKAYQMISEKKVDKPIGKVEEAFEAECAAAIDAAAAGSKVDKKKLLAVLIRHTIGFGAIEPLLKDSKLQDVYVDSRSPLVHVVHSRWGECVTNLHMTQQELGKLATRLRALSGRSLDASSPVLHAEIESLGIRAAGICSPSTYEGTGFAFRRRKQSPWTLAEFIQAGMLDAKAAGLLSFLVDGQSTILVTGPRASGKTSLMTALMLEIPQSTRIITIEDTPEIPVDALQKGGFKVEHLKTEAWAKGFELSAEDALRTSLRLGESTLVLGEVRGAEAKSLFEAMRIGAAGNVVMGTIHGSSAYDTWDRVVNDLGVPASSFKAVDIILSAGSIRFGDATRRHRRLMAVTEVRKNWKGEPSSKDFVEIALFSRKGGWKLDLAKSHTVRKIAEAKGISITEAIRSISYRARMKSDLVQLAKQRPEAVSAPFVVAANNAWLRFAASSKNAGQAYSKWKKWLESQ